ncbi:MAG: hypothetical protein IPL32_16460 [Chloracidobacterium sp.]|nr:hypothetical protein [Chloracidobacterium sp.]
MKKFHPYLVAIAILVATKFSLAQTTVITEQEYWAGIRSGYATTEKVVPRRETVTYESLSDGKVTYSTTKISEYQSEDTYRIIETVVRNGRTSIFQTIQIGVNRYCRENKAKWKRCFEDPPISTSRADETKYAVQRDKDSLTLIRTSTFSKKENGKVEPKKFVSEDKFVVNVDMSARERSEVTTISDTQTIVSRDTTKFEYGITLKPIKPPISR